MSRATIMAALFAWLALNVAGWAVAVRRVQRRQPEADRLALAVAANVFWTTPGLSLNGTPAAGHVLAYACNAQEWARNQWRRWRVQVAA